MDLQASRFSSSVCKAERHADWSKFLHPPNTHLPGRQDLGGQTSLAGWRGSRRERPSGTEHRASSSQRGQEHTAPASGGGGNGGLPASGALGPHPGAGSGLKVAGAEAGAAGGTACSAEESGLRPGNRGSREGLLLGFAFQKVKDPPVAGRAVQVLGLVRNL